jgi:UDP-glucose 4-epimerase
MRAIVTGGAGFIGSYLVDRLLHEGNAVTVVDNMSCGCLENLKHHSGNPDLIIQKDDIKNAKKLDRIFAGHDVVFHLAAHANIRQSLVNHRADLDNNVIGTLNVLEAMCKNEIQDLVFASSSAVYGEATVRPTPEDYSSVQTSLYGASKLACEAYAEAYTEITPIRLWAFRFSNVIGERCRRGIIWDFVHKLSNNPGELEILGDGKQSKEYLHAQDCVNGMIMGYRRATGKVNIFNLGVEEQTLVDEVADIVIEEMGLKKIKRSYTGGPRGWVGDNPVVELSLERIKKLGWSQSIPSEQAIRRAVRWTLEHRSDRSS